MSFRYELKLRPRARQSRDDPLATFYWPAEGPSSFSAPFGPRLAAIGDVPLLNVDLVRLALLVFAADRSTIRKVGYTNWSSRDFVLTVPVSDAEVWQIVSVELGELLGFLTGDTWAFDFRNARPPREQIARRLDLQTPSRVVLMSGGADSALGVLESRRRLERDESHVLVSHVGLTALAPVQRKVAETASTIAPGSTQSVEQIRLARRQQQVDGSKFKNEPSSRSRSLLFLALGLAHASIHGVPLWIPENGFASLNPPLAPNRRGSLSTRTTHPSFLAGLSRILDGVGVHSNIVNPFAHLTKGEMFRNAADRYGRAAISDFLSATHSCGLTGQRWKGISTTTQCGVCFGCVVRRASFAAAELKDGTTYADTDPSDDMSAWLDRNSVIPDMRRFAKRGVTRRDLLAMSLPDDYPLGDARDLCARGVLELREFVS
ncbi:MAG: hypothetical protein OXH61_03510 [Acidimicrobiaceae bacterium]|nr:hypothetical protein [Acidimicrobiaceae bacterium]